MASSYIKLEVVEQPDFLHLFFQLKLVEGRQNFVITLAIVGVLNARLLFVYS